MPDDRLLHRCQGFSAKLAELTHLEYRVWVQYLLSSDDFGVMPDAPATIRGSNLALAKEPEEVIAAAIARIVQIGLVDRFEHQGQGYLWSPDWQDYQSIRYPRTTYLPMPIPEIFPKCSRKTAELFQKHFAFPQSQSGANHRLTANGKRLLKKRAASGPKTVDEVFGSESTADAAGWLLRSWPEWYSEERNGARIVMREARDWPTAKAIVETWPDRAYLEKLARAFLSSTSDKLKWCPERSLAQFVTAAPGIDAWMRAA